MTLFKLPDLGEGLPDAEIHQWYVKEGDIVKVDDPLVSMETAKAVVDVPAPYNGKIIKLHGQPGDIIKTGNPLVEFEGDELSETAQQISDSGTVVGTMEVGNTVIEEAAIGITPSRTSESSIKAIPVVRALAKKLNVDLTTVIPTGPNNQITAEDVEKAAPAGASAGMQEGAVIEPLRGVRRAMATAMAQSHAEVVPVTLMDDANINAWPEKTDITYRVIRALVAGFKAEPALNAHFDGKKLERRLFNHINIGIAMDSKDGLFVPVLKHAETLSPSDVRNTIEQYKEQVRNRTITADQLKGSTIQLSNFGTFAGRYANPIVVPPTVAILGTGKIRQEIVAINSDIQIHRILPLSLTIDHRAISGGEAARFLAAVIDDLGKSD